MNRTTTFRRAFPWGAALFSGALLSALPGRAQTVIDEHFDGGASTTGFTITQDGGNCQWVYAPDGLDANNFNQDFGGALPSGGGFDDDFVFIDSDECNGGGSGGTVHTYLTSATFDASATGYYILSFSHQFESRLESYARVSVYNGSDWVQVANWTDPNGGTGGEGSIGYPNPAVSTTLNITDALAGTASGQIRFEFSSGWDWWWAIDNIVLSRTDCAFPNNLAVADVTTDGGTVSWDDNGSSGYDWVITTGGLPDGTNEVATGDGTNTTFTGLLGGTAYTAFVRAQCDGGGTSAWSDGVPFVTLITNDEATGAMPVTVNPDLECGTVTHGTVFGATNSGITSDCFGTPDDDVWFSFTATNATQYISLLNLSGENTYMIHTLWTGDPSAPTEVDNSCSDADLSAVSGLTVGQVYYLQVYTYTDEPGQNTQFDVCIGTPPPPPANDEPCGAVPVTVNADDQCGSTTHGTVASATGSNLDTPCFGTPDDDVWYSFVATNPAHYISLLNINGSTTDMYLAVWTGDCTAPTIMPFSCSDYETMAISGLTVGTTYYIQVYTYTSDAGQTSSFDLCVGTPVDPPPANDEPCGATAMTVNPDADCGTTSPGTVLGATGSNLETTCYGTPDDDVWFSFVATNPALLFSLNNVQGSTTDMYHALWAGDDCSTLTLVESSCNDGDVSLFSGLTIGTTYYVQVYTYTGEPGQTSTFDACIGTPPPPPANDECAGAAPVTVNLDELCDNQTPGSVVGATGSGLDSDCFGTPDDDVWFSFIALATEHSVSLNDVNGSTSDMYMALWTGDCGNLTEVPNTCSDPEQADYTDLTVGTTYYLQVYTYTSEPLQTSTFNVCVGTDPSLFPPDCEGVPGGPAVPGTPCINEQFNVGGTWTASCLCQPNVGITELSAAPTIGIAPNPASTELYLTVPDSRTVSVKIYDMLGHIALVQPMAKHISIAQLAPSTYTLMALDAQGNVLGRARFVKH